MSGEVTSAPLVLISVSAPVIEPSPLSMTARVTDPGPTKRMLAPLARNRTLSVKLPVLVTVKL